MNRRTYLVLGLSVLVAGPAIAQQAGNKGPRGWLRILPVGEDPPFRQIVRNGVRYEADVAPGSQPPSKVELSGTGKEQREAKLTLGRISEGMVFQAGAVQMRAPEFDQGGDTPWHALQVPEGPAWLAVMWRDRQEGKWTKARHLLLRDDPAAFAAGKVRFVNVTPVPVAVVLGDKTIEARPGQPSLHDLPTGKQIPLRVAIRDNEGDWKTMHNGALMQVRGERTNVVFSIADGEKPRRPILVTSSRERALLPKLPKKS